jgi:hypothetical protein
LQHCHCKCLSLGPHSVTFRRVGSVVCSKDCFWLIILQAGSLVCPVLIFLNPRCLVCRCEAFSTYPRTYDLLHAWTVFSDLDKRGCSGEDLLIEMDRILRPTGFIIVRDKSTVIEFIKKYLHALQWEAITVVDAEPSPESDENEIILLIRKKLWLPEAGTQDST